MTTHGKKLLDADLEVVNQALITNLFGPWRLSQLCIPIMKRNRYGRIVNVSSGAGSLHYMGAGTPAYSISKTALNAFTRILQQNFMVLVFWLIQLIQDGYLQIWVAEEEEVDVQ